MDDLFASSSEQTMPDAKSPADHVKAKAVCLVEEENDASGDLSSSDEGALPSIQGNSTSNPAMAAEAINIPHGYHFAEDGLYFEAADSDGEQAIWISAPFQIIAETRDENSTHWGLLIRWRDRDARTHEWTLPRRLLHTDARNITSSLEDGGLTCSISGARLLQQFFSLVQTRTRLMSVDRAGWHRTSSGYAFVLPDGDTIEIGARSTAFRSPVAISKKEFSSAGTLAEWQQNVAKYVIGNSRLALFICAAFAGPLLDIIAEQSGGIHLGGKSQSGKSTCAYAAGSVWGKGDRDGQIRSWRGTANGLEGIAAATADTVMILDELGQTTPKDAGEIVYMLANDAGKQRAGRMGEPRDRKTWRAMYLSTGEVSLGTKLGEIGKQILAGQDIRLVNLASDPGAGYGVFETLHDKASGSDLADHIRLASRTWYGTAAQVFLARLVQERTADAQAIKKRADRLCKQFLDRFLPNDADGQIRSVAMRFALIFAAGELARNYGVLPWPEDEALKAASICFKAWLDDRDGTGPTEDMLAISKVRAFIEQHGESRFTDITKSSSDSHVSGKSKTFNRAGFRRKVHVAEGERWEYMLLPETWKGQVCKGQDPVYVEKVVHDAGFLVHGDGKNLARREAIPGEGRLRVYVVKGNIIGDNQGT